MELGERCKNLTCRYKFGNYPLYRLTEVLNGNSILENTELERGLKVVTKTSVMVKRSREMKHQ
jgi:hypothetical protein